MVLLLPLLVVSESFLFIFVVSSRSTAFARYVLFMHEKVTIAYSFFFFFFLIKGKGFKAG